MGNIASQVARPRYVVYVPAIEQELLRQDPLDDGTSGFERRKPGVLHSPTDGEVVMGALFARISKIPTRFFDRVAFVIFGQRDPAARTPTTIAGNGGHGGPGGQSPPYVPYSPDWDRQNRIK